MKKLVPLLFISHLLLAQSPENGARHEFIIANWGHLNAAKDNAVLLPSHYLANYHGYEWLIGPDRALATRKRKSRD